MKKLYTSPEAELVEFDVKDVITTSGFESNPMGDADSIWTSEF